MLMSMLMSHDSVDFFVLSFILPCVYAYVASETRLYSLSVLSKRQIQTNCGPSQRMSVVNHE